MKIDFVVNGPPVTWKRAKRGEHGSYTDPRAAAHMEKVRAAARNAGVRACLAQPFRLSCRFYRDMDPWDVRFGDEDNLRKLLKDALTGIVWQDDRWVTRVGAGGKFRDERPRTEIEIEPLEFVVPFERLDLLSPGSVIYVPPDGHRAIVKEPLTPTARERMAIRRLRPSVRRPT